jgi:hypothetical protein
MNRKHTIRMRRLASLFILTQSLAIILNTSVCKRQAVQFCIYFVDIINTRLSHRLSEVTYVTGSQLRQVAPMSIAITWPLSALLTSGSGSAFLIGRRVSKICFGSPAKVKTLDKVGHGLLT